MLMFCRLQKHKSSFPLLRNDFPLFFFFGRRPASSFVVVDWSVTTSVEYKMSFNGRRQTPAARNKTMPTTMQHTFLLLL